MLDSQLTNIDIYIAKARLNQQFGRSNGLGEVENLMVGLLLLMNEQGPRRAYSRLSLSHLGEYT